MTTNGTFEDERNVIATILDRHSTQQFQLIRSQTTMGHLLTATEEERRQRLEYIQQRIPEISAATLEDFATKNHEQHDVESVFVLGPKFVAVTDEEFRQLLRNSGWRGLSTRYPGTRGIIDCSRVGFSEHINEALVYIGHQRAARSGSGWFRLLQRQWDGTWCQVRTARAWIS